MEKMNNILAMIKNKEKIIRSLEEMSAPSKFNITQEEVEWLSSDCPEIKTIYAFSFDKIKELQYGSGLSSCDTLFYTSKESEKLNYLIEFKRTDLNRLKKYCVNDKSSNKYKDSINRKIQDSATVLKNTVFDDERDGQVMVSSTHIVVVYAEDGKGPVYMEKPDKSCYKRKDIKSKKKSAIYYNMPDMAFMLESSISPKNYVEKSISKSAQEYKFSSKKEKSNLIQNLSVTAKKFKYSEDKSSNTGYVTLLNKNEFIQEVRSKLKEWDWGKFSIYFDSFNQNVNENDKEDYVTPKC